jgi:hypothetical protein
MNGISYESNRTILYTAQVHGGAGSFNVTRLAGDWDRSPTVPLWSEDGRIIFVDTADQDRQRLFLGPVDAGDDYEPANITDEGVPANFYRLPGDQPRRLHRVGRRQRDQVPVPSQQGRQGAGAQDCVRV